MIQLHLFEVFPNPSIVGTTVSAADRRPVRVQATASGCAVDVSAVTIRFAADEVRAAEVPFDLSFFYFGRAQREIELAAGGVTDMKSGSAIDPCGFALCRFRFIDADGYADASHFAVSRQLLPDTRGSFADFFRRDDSLGYQGVDKAVGERFDLSEAQGVLANGSVGEEASSLQLTLEVIDGRAEYVGPGVACCVVYFPSFHSFSSVNVVVPIAIGAIFRPRPGERPHRRRSHNFH